MRISYRFCFAAFCLFVLSAMTLVSCKDDSSNKPFSLSESKLSLKVAETATIRVSGVSGFTVEMTGNIASYTIDGNVIYVKAEKVGTAALRVLSGSETLECQVTVSENSAQIGFSPIRLLVWKCGSRIRLIPRLLLGCRLRTRKM